MSDCRRDNPDDPQDDDERDDDDEEEPFEQDEDINY